RILAEHLQDYMDDLNVIVLALPRGGVPVAYEVAQSLAVPMDIFLVRKLGVPGHEELAFGAVATGGVRVLNRRLMQECQVTDQEVARITTQELRELHRREYVYRGNSAPLDVYHRTVIVVDDGLATGASMYAAVEALNGQHPARLIVGVPVVAREVVERF